MKDRRKDCPPEVTADIKRKDLFRFLYVTSDYIYFTIYFRLNVQTYTSAHSVCVIRVKVLIDLRWILISLSFNLCF